jgi:hypothetical protein
MALYGDRVVIEETLSGTLQALFRETAPPAEASTLLADPTAARAEEALHAYYQAMHACRREIGMASERRWTRFPGAWRSCVNMQVTMSTARHRSLHAVHHGCREGA